MIKSKYNCENLLCIMYHVDTKKAQPFSSRCVECGKSMKYIEYIEQGKMTKRQQEKTNSLRNILINVYKKRD